MENTATEAAHPMEILAFSAPEPSQIRTQLRDLLSGKDCADPAAIGGKCRTLRARFNHREAFRLLVAAEPGRNMKEELDKALFLLKNPPETGSWRQDRVFFGTGRQETGPAFLFPGQGSQYVQMA